jgi:hypothetical protein
MTTPESTDESSRSDVSETDGPVTGADAVPDKTSDTPAKGAEFDDEDGSPGDADKSDIPGAGADTSVRDQD